MAVVDNILAPLTFSMRIDRTAVLADFRCSFWNEDRQAWSSRGLAVTHFSLSGDDELFAHCARWE